jgi:UDP:flavonoid glycosyltransferase YjiC (YdhE family)
LAPISDDLREVYTSGDLVFYPDVPEFVPVNGAPAHHHYIGPCLWTCNDAKPEWWDTVMDSPLPKIFVTLGSSGPIKALPAILKAAAQLPVKVLLATSSRIDAPVDPNIHTAPLLPYEETARCSAVVVSHGGTGGVYLTLAAGTPMLAIPNNVDNHLSTKLLEEHHAGLSVRVENADVKNICRALKRLLYEAEFKSAMAKWPALVHRCDSRKLFPALLSKWFTNPQFEGKKQWQDYTQLQPSHVSLR